MKNLSLLLSAVPLTEKWKASTERMTRPSYAWSWRSLVCCQSSRRQAENEDGSGEDGEMRQKSCSLPFLPKWNTTDRLSKKTSYANQTDRGSFSGQRCARPVHLHNWRRLKCMWVTVTTVQWKPLFSSHVTHKGDPYRRLVWLSFFFFFFNPPLWPEVCSLKVGVMHTKTLQKSPSTRLTAPDSEKKASLRLEQVCQSGEMHLQA